jgi:alcohol dehydrogenase YqhD (iron-dependent ADH family)
MKHLKRFDNRGWNKVDESIVFSGLTLLTGLGIIAPWLISVYLEDRNKKLEKEAEEELNKRDLETKAKIENFIQKIQPFIEGFEQIRKSRNTMGGSGYSKIY